MSNDEAQAATPAALVAIIAIQTTTERRADVSIVSFIRRCLEMSDEVDRRRASRIEAGEKDNGGTPVAA